MLVRGIPKTTNESCSTDVDDFFTKYHPSSYLFHQVVYKAGKVQKIMVSNSHTTFLSVWRVGMISNRLVWICTFYLHISILPSASGVKLFRILQTGAKKACRKLKHFTDTTVDQSCKAITYRCCLCGASSNSFQLLPTDEVAQSSGKVDLNDSSLITDNEVGSFSNLTYTSSFTFISKLV